MELSEKKINEINFVGSGWTVQGVNHLMINILINKEKINDMEANDKGFVKLTVVKKKETENGRADFYVKENTHFRDKIKEQNNKKG